MDYIPEDTALRIINRALDEHGERVVYRLVTHSEMNIWKLQRHFPAMTITDIKVIIRAAHEYRPCLRRSVESAIMERFNKNQLTLLLSA